MDETGDDNADKNEGDEVDNLSKNLEIFSGVIKLADVSNKTLVVCAFVKRFSDFAAEIQMNF